ncbi:nicotinate-nucleotide--dimethylbenzimidazole phosphoribosyltransferase [Caldalkalibacillus thermarum]|uniref:nicotinate-nucleotide--dimethylbenzimidazole phosphoribosyltransferase n=1 Tax=Caldalkalibacillus thermarum TaxID=296745 RepID=UPI001664753B|nr:nicotinate-nucleotide--dimethylbenzimidazole phosphoribosyltransferase [Caldalkalibacillus thermarum]GGK23416.1 nicotinate-nucleotide--dimethylbenzimidazole phosphoribosyltransferase [Caldalkalibacillus thermarum]
MQASLNHYCLSIPSVDHQVGQEAARYLDTLTKPKGSLGRLEAIAVQLATITGQVKPRVSPPGIIVFAADHGVAEEGVSAYPQEVTAQMVRNFLQGGAAINVFARQIGALLEVVDVGVAQPLEASGLVSRKVRYGTANFLKEPAMSQEEAVAAIEAGIERAEALIKRGIKSLIVGEMGIGNTTASSAMLAAAKHRIPVIADGFICTVAALLAVKLCPRVSDVLLAGHRSQEPGHQVALSLLDKEPLLDLGMRLGEGSGAAVAFPLVEAACRMIGEMATFQEAGVTEGGER